jgi:hypothetical protein
VSKGPEQLKFEQAVGEKGHARSDASDLSTAQFKWQAIAEVLEASADDLETRAYSASAISEQTGQAMQDAFLRTAATMRKRSAKLKDGAQALGEAAATLQSAQSAKSQLRELADPGPWTGGTPVTDAELTAKSEHDTAVSTYEADKKHNETIAAQHNQAMDQQNEKSTAVMKQVYGYQDPETAPGAYGSGSAEQPGSISGSGTTAARGDATHGTTTTSGGVTTGLHHGGGGDATVHHGGEPTGLPTGNPTGTPQGGAGAPGSDAGTIGGGGWTPGTPAQTSPGSVGSSFGGVGATIGAGIAGGAGGMLGGVRGGSALPANGAGATSGRPIGSTARSGSAGTLGRSAAARGAALSAEVEAAMRRNGAAGRTAGAAGRGSTGAPGAGRSGSRGTAGRGVGSGRSERGAGTGGQGRGRGKKDATATLEHMIIEEDWLDDEGHAPAVID